MGEPNNLLQRYFSDNRRFADLVNTYVGSDILAASDLAEKDSQLTTRLSGRKHQKSLSKQRDMIRKASVGMDFVLIGIENQMSIHYAMPIRTLLYDGIGYEEQLSSIAKHNKKEGILTDEEFLSGSRREDRVIPIFTLVVYYGQKPWDGAVDLHGLMDLQEVPVGIRSLVHNYPINLLQVSTFEGVEKFKTDVKAVFGFLQNAHSKDRLKQFINANHVDFEHLDEGRNEGRNEGRANMLQLIEAMAEDNQSDEIRRLATEEGFLEEMLRKYNI